MAKSRKPTESANGSQDRVKGFTGHHKDMVAAGASLIGDSRPRGKPYKLEEWLTTDRKYRMLKVSDKGDITAYDEVANYSDPRAAAENLK